MYKKVFIFGAVAVLAACSFQRPVGEAYWQRVEDASALYMTGPKAQQELHENIASCVRQIDELVELEALRETMPPDTHSEYHRALKASGDLDYYDAPQRYGDQKVAHSDFHDFESCMRSSGWERVRFVRYQTALQAGKTYKATQELRTYGVTGAAAEQKQREKVEALKDDYAHLNQ
jgi:hypothetical protein